VQSLNSKKFFLYLLIASVGVSALMGIGVILFGNFGELEERVLLTTLTINVTSVLGLACGAYLESRRGKVLPLFGIIAAAASAVLWIYLIWHGTVHESIFVRSLLSATLLATSCSLISLLLLANLDRRFIWSRYAVHISVWVLTAYLLYLIWDRDAIGSETTPRILGTLSIIVAALTLVTPIFHKLSAGEANVAEIDIEIASLKKRIEDLEVKKAAIEEVATV